MKGRGKQHATAGAVAVFRNAPRIDRLHAAIQEGDRVTMEEIINDRGMNATASKKLKGKNISWETLLEDSVYQVSDPTVGEPVVVKLFDEFPFHEIGGNIIATKLIETAGPFFVRCLDAGRFTDTAASYFIVMECIPDDTDGLDLSEPINMYNMFYQVAYATHQLSSACQLQHFDMRFDNIRIKHLPSNKDFFKNGVKSSFLVKIGDWGQCEFNFGDSRPLNDSVPRDPAYKAKWGFFPDTYSNYDFQYFLSTLTPTLDSLHGLSFYYIYNITLEHMQPMSFTSAQDRPQIITNKSAYQIVSFLKVHVLPTVSLLPDEDGDKENSC